MSEHVAVIVPAHNEAGTIGEVIDVAREAGLVDEVIVVDNASWDETAEVAEAHGATVVAEPDPGKGQALASGVRATDAPVLVFLDADLTGLRPDHVDRLAGSVLLGDAGMARGLFDRGAAQNRLFLSPMVPTLTGERALRRELFESLDRQDIEGYRVEAALNNRARELGLEVHDFVLDGMFHVTKEEKERSRAVGWAKKLGMLATAAGAYVAWWTIRRRAT